MCEIMEKIAKEERSEDKSESKLELLFDLVPIAEAAKRANMTERFLQKI